MKILSCVKRIGSNYFYCPLQSRGSPQTSIFLALKQSKLGGRRPLLTLNANDEPLQSIEGCRIAAFTVDFASVQEHVVDEVSHRLPAQSTLKNREVVMTKYFHVFISLPQNTLVMTKWLAKAREACNVIQFVTFPPSDDWDSSNNSRFRH